MRILLMLVLAFGVCAGAAAQTSPAPAGTSPATAATPVASANPYSATVPVAGTSDAQRNEAIAAALAVVLQQVAPGFVPAAGALAGASGYVRDYHYRRAASGAGLELQVDFDPTAVTRLLAQQGGANAVAAPTVAAGQAPAAAGTSTAPAQAQVATSGTAIVWVGGIDSTHAFAGLLSTLRGDPQLHDVVPVAADHDSVLLQVDYSQPLATVLAALETPAGHLTQALQPHAGADATLHWNP